MSLKKKGPNALAFSPFVLFIIVLEILISGFYSCFLFHTSGFSES